ncbi:protein GL2-INTERACTING REPRESSOR 1 [Ricinus communis]|uniref:GIR1-like zinc ribbon domain-containing protein n=1 Tax=Ricinus communis TaxID=3988 RepID=B9SCZ2_RICCO|nr:protein GL2-INTERACTING REPRESSOR 1 [Ricinus communis]EEF38587.1 conserved hypothetical protein [Ricinus communis]|eukprot:XP_002523861.1 uncharacterized protein LOC8263326 [Ricinus communis]
MSGNSTPKLELKLNLSPPRVNDQRAESPESSAASSCSEMSSKNSCVSSEDAANNYKNGRSQGSSSMVLVGCRRCLMYLMLSDVDPKCPKCNSTVLLHLLSDEFSNNPPN